jgi:hypothetical protein
MRGSEEVCQKTVIVKRGGRRPFGINVSKRNDNVKIYLNGIGCPDVDCNHLGELLFSYGGEYKCLVYVAYVFWSKITDFFRGA